VALDDLLRGWADTTYRHIPAGSPYPVTDFRFAAASDANRWNRRGEPTLYLACDRGGAVAEFARHIDEERLAALAELVLERRLFRLEIALDYTLDLRAQALIQQLSIADAPARFLDRAVARAVAGFLRATTSAQGLLVPSVAFLDDPSRFLVVCFLEKLPSESERWIRSVTVDGNFRLTGQPLD